MAASSNLPMSFTNQSCLRFQACTCTTHHTDAKYGSRHSSRIIGFSAMCSRNSLTSSPSQPHSFLSIFDFCVEGRVYCFEVPIWNRYKNAYQPKPAEEIGRDRKQVWVQSMACPELCRECAFVLLKSLATPIVLG